MNDGFLGAKGILNERGVFTGSCIGDSGGPLMAQNEEDRRTLIGIVSGKMVIVWLTGILGRLTKIMEVNKGSLKKVISITFKGLMGAIDF